jgi:HlyD family secretion protein
LATKNVISQEDLDANKTAKKNAAEELNSIDARLETAHAKLEEAKWDKANKMVNSEKAGVVFDTYFLPTEFVTTGKPVLSILSDNDKYIVFYVPEHLLPKFKIKQNLAVICDGVKDPFQATVSFIYPKVEFAPPIIYTDESRTGLVYKVEASVNENTADNGCLHIGQPVDIMLPDK